MLTEEMAVEGEARLSNSAIRRHVMVLSQILKTAVADGRLGRNVAAGIKLPPERAREMRFLTADEVLQIADAIEPFYCPMVLTAAYVGLRWGELTGLALNSVDPLRKTIRVERQLQDVNGTMAFGPPKTKSGVRTVSVPATLIEILHHTSPHRRFSRADWLSRACAASRYAKGRSAGSGYGQ
jgi:integrase